MPMSEWSTIFEPMDEAGVPIAPKELALAIALAEQRPAHRAFWIRGLDNVHRHIEATCLPLVGQAQRFLGAIAIFWEVRGLAKITWPFLRSACYDQPYAELNDTGHCSEVYHLGATLG